MTRACAEIDTEECSGKWQSRAARRGKVRVMFPRTDGGGAPDYGPALHICATCAVIEECRRAGRQEFYGVWGGWTPATRASARRHPRPSRGSGS